ncbi:hypothetical protein Tco_0669060 [Tanacetum coccineum]
MANLDHIRYALIENPTIYVSLIQQFWNTTTARTLDNEEIKITPTIDGKVKIVSEASIRRHLKLEDSDGISNLPTTKIFNQLALMGYDEGSTLLVESHHTPTGAPSISQPHLSPTLRSSIRQETEVPQPNSPPHTNVADEAASTGVDVRYGGAATTVTGLEVGQYSGNIDKTPTMPHDSPLLRVHILGSDEGIMQHNELMDLVTKLSNRVVTLETDLTQTNKVYGVAFTKLIKKVKMLEKNNKLNKSKRKLRLVLSDEEGLDSDILSQRSFQTCAEIAQIDEDEGITLVQMGVSTVSTDFTIANVPVTTAGTEISTASPEVKTTGDFVDDIVAESLVCIRRSATKTKDKGKGIMEESESAMTKTKRQQEQERLGLETVNGKTLEQEFSKELVQILQTEEREKYNEDDQAKMLVDLINQRKRYFDAQKAKAKRNKPMTQAQQRTYMSNYIKHMGKQLLEVQKGDAEEELGQESSKRQKIVPEEGMNIEALQTKYPIIDWEVYTEGSRADDLVKLWSLVQERFNSTEPTEDKEIEIWVELKRLFEPDADDELWKSQKYIHDVTWILYDTCGVHHVSTKDGVDIYMLVEREYPLSRGVLTQMLVAKLLVEQDNEMSKELLRKIFMQIERPRR